MLYPIYYDPIYFPECYPEIFATPSSVKLWLETSLCSHISLCRSCSSRHLASGVKFSVQWRDSYYLICLFAGGKLKQCRLSLEDLQSKKYSHCQIVSRLCKASLPVPPSASRIVDLYSVIAKEEPAWLCYPVELYRLHLFDLPAPILSFAAKSCSSDTLPVKACRDKSSCISIIIDHFILERNIFISAMRNQTTTFSQESLCIFVGHIERLYGTSVAALLREPPFQLSPCLVHRPSLSGGLQWFHESIDELVRRLRSSFSADALRGELKKIPAHRRPVYDSRHHHKTSNSLVVHVFRRVLYLLAIDMGPLSKIVLSLCPGLNFNYEPSPEHLIDIIVENEYGSSIFKCLSKSVVGKDERAKNSRREKKFSKVQTAKDALERYETSWPSLVPQAHIFECLNEYRKETIWTDPPICAVCGRGSREINVPC